MNVKMIQEKIQEGDMNELQTAVGLLMANEDSNELFQAAEELSSYGYIEEAHVLYEELVERHPDEKILYLNIAEILIEQSLEEEALEMLENIRSSDELYPSALILAADCYENMGLTEVSEEKLIKANAILPNEPITIFALAEIYYHHSKFQEAFDAYQRLSIDQINSISVANRVANCLVSMGRFEESLPYFEKAEKSNPEINLYFEYALAAYSAEDYDLAVRQFKNLLSMDKEYQSAYLYVSKSFEKLGDFEQAISYAQSGLKLDEYQKELRLHLSQLYLYKNDFSQSIKILQETIAIDPTYLEAILFLAKLYIQQEDFDSAIDLIQEMKKDNEEDPQFNWILATCYNGLEDYKKAAQHYQEGYAIFEDNVEFLEEYAEFLIEEGRREEAKRIIEKLLSIDPSNAEYVEALDRI